MAVHRGFFHAVRPGFDFRRRLLRAVRIQITGNFLVGGTGLELFAHFCVFDALPVQKHVIERAISVVLAYRASNVGTRLVGHPREDGVATYALTGAGGGLFSEVFSVVTHIIFVVNPDHPSQ